ncbi:MAG: Smr/MutS family protein, partial [Bacilli bacterium]
DNDLSTQNLHQDTELKKGMRVYISVYDTYGIINKKLSSHRYEVQMGIAQMDLDDEYLQIAKSEKETPLKKTASTIVMRKAVTGTLDLRGKRYEEASDMIDKYLDDALYAGLTSISVIHGFGSGVIRKLVQEKLKGNKNIKEYRYGDAHEGGHGCTIAIFNNK